jgi:hypothetical protein
MKLPSALLYSSLLLGGTGVLADQMTVSIDGFGDPTAFSITDTSTLNLRVTELVPADGDNVSTHVLIEGLSPLEDGTMTYASTYSGINVDSGETQDVGVIYLEMPEGSDPGEGTVTSPVVGVVQRSGSWADYTLVEPSTSVGGSSGDGDYGSGTLDFTLIRDAEVFLGSTSYTVVDENTIDVEAFTLTKDGAVSYQMSGATLLRDGDRFYGTLTNLSDGAAYDSLIFSISFTGIPDLDNDGIPDISDGEVEAGGLTLGIWQFTDIGWVYGLTPEWGYSFFMGYVYMADLPYVYQVDIGWLYLATSTPPTYWFFNLDLGWIFVDDGNGGWYQFDPFGPTDWCNFLTGACL